VYLVDRDHLGGFHSADDSQIVQALSGAIGAAFGTPAYWNGTVYYVGANDVPKAFALRDGQLSPTPTSRAATQFRYPGGAPAVSANGTGQAILWVLESDAYTFGGPGVLHAYERLGSFH
jgi:hypothetical protein